MYFAKTDILNDDALFDSLFETVPEERKIKVRRLNYRDDKNQSLAAGVLKEYALKENPGCFVNLSHSGKIALCSASDTDVGCDVEMLKKANLKIAERFFTEKENDIIAESENPDDTFFRLWTLKESFMKCLGLGFSLPMANFSVDINNNYKLTQTVNDKEYFFREYDILQGYKISCCSLSNDFGEIAEVDLTQLVKK